MNNEFKKISKDDTTRYVLESASSGGTSSGSVATVSKSLGGVQRRGGNLLVQDTSQKLTPRSPVAHAAQKVAKGSGKHTDRKQQSKQVRGEKHKGKDFAENQDHEITMAGSELHSIFQNAKQLHSMIKAKSEEEGLDAWQQSKITKAADYLNSVLQSLQHEMMGEQGVAEGSLNEGQYEMMMRNGQVKKFIAKDDADAKRIAAGHGAKSVIRLKGGVPAGKIAEQGVAEGGPFSYGKPPRKGSIAANAAQKRKEQDRKTPPIEPKNQHVGVAKVIKDVKEGRLNEFAPDGFGGDDDGEGFDPYIAQMAEEDGLIKGVSLVDGATLEQAMKIQYWHSRYDGMYKHYFAKGFKKGRLDKIRHNNKQYNLNLQLNKDGSVSHGEQDMEEARVDQLPTKGADYSDYDTDHLKFMLRPGILHRNEARFKALIRKELKKREQQSQQGVAEGERTMSRAAKGNEKYGKDGMKALAKAGREGASEKELDAIRDKHDHYNEGWSQKYKSSINCSHPRGFSQKAHCAGKRKHNEGIEMEMTCPDCGMCATHGNNMMEVKQRLDAKCWKGKHKEGTKIKGGVRVNNCVPNESVAESTGKICPQCGMKNCSCPPGKCKCKPLPGFPKIASSKKRGVGEAMLPKSAFAGSDKNKLGPAAHLKGSMRRPARQGDLVGGDAQESIELGEKAVSQQQQKFFGMVHAMQKGKKIPGASPELKKTAKSMSKSDAKDFAKTKHAGLPKKVSEFKMTLPPQGLSPEEAQKFAADQQARSQAMYQQQQQQQQTPQSLPPGAIPGKNSPHPKTHMYDEKLDAWIPGPPLTPATEDTYMESLSAALEQKLNINDPLETWRDDFEHADPVKYKQFRNKTVEKKHRMADVARYRQIQQK